MASDEQVDTLANAVRTTLHGTPALADISRDADLIRSVCIDPSTWHAWFDGKQHVRGRRALDRSAPPAQLARDVLDSLAPCLQSTHGSRGHDHIDRERLLGFSRAATSGHVEDLTRLWVATMMWGSGTTNGRGPWRTADGLADPRLDATLSATAAAVRRGGIKDAHDGFKLDGCGEAFFTKWFWTVSLAGDIRPQPLILDKRVRSSLWHVMRGSSEWSAPSGAGGYLAYLDLIDRTGTQLQHDIKAMTAEKVEWVLFQAKPDAGDQLVLRNGS